MKVPAIFKNSVVFFLVKLFALYFSWYFLYNGWLHPNQKLDLFVVRHTVNVSRSVLEFLGYTVFYDNRLIGITGTSGLWVGDNCNGIALFAIFSIFIIAFPGPIVKKTLYIVAGILTIQLLNIARVVVLAIIETYSYEFTEFNHTYTFTIIIYGYIFFLWMLWVSKLNKNKKLINEA